jgi:hypothetical protein
MEETMDSEYFWVVLCKNRWRHIGHPILLGEADSFSGPPHLDGDFKVKCDVCGKECKYSPRDILRFEAIEPESFSAHAMFKEAA